MELSIREAAELLGRSERTLRHLAQNGRMPARRIGSRWVVRRDDLEAWARGEGSQSTHDESTPPLETFEPAEPAAAAFVDDAHTPASEARPVFTVSFEALTPADPDSRHFPRTVRELDSFAVGAALLAEVASARRDPRANDTLLAEPEAALRAVLGHLADGCHQDDPRRKSECFREAQSRACAALSGLVHYNLLHAEPDLKDLSARIDAELLTALQALRAGADRRLTLRGRLVTAAEAVDERVLGRARRLRGATRFADRLDDLERSLGRALRYAL